MTISPMYLTPGMLATVTQGNFKGLTVLVMESYDNHNYLCVGPDPDEGEAEQYVYHRLALKPWTSVQNITIQNGKVTNYKL